MLKNTLFIYSSQTFVTNKNYSNLQNFKSQSIEVLSIPSLIWAKFLN